MPPLDDYIAPTRTSPGWIRVREVMHETLRPNVPARRGVQVARIALSRIAVPRARPADD